MPCYFIHGNRDFLVGQRFARQSGMILLAEEERLDLYGREVLIMHGDTLCTDDQGYLAFRAKVHTPWIQRLFWPCRCLSAVASPPACAPTAKPPTAVNQWKLWM